MEKRRNPVRTTDGGPQIAERFHPRVDANLPVKVLLKGRSVMVRARDVSMAGLFLMAHPADTARELAIAVPLPGDREIVTTCQIRRREVDGVALEFGELDWDDLIALARYLHPRLP
ncbi:pilus assembly protein PilZ [Myxococcus xanthus]|uniref:Pilus assembly protein PilZ n=1 Tax=Myxococcus xanthus TaxID=34 RepID=A0AAE6KUT5_MYXXA|nr:pilus assembly protein PilZ [Myxococcus xanthus]QDE77831.1 pilus assembly protein PilZ [Myxococcus xanthus]QDE85214.1 pilus assembly protein PilZ [Myxococcus xanthus]QDE99375.1 pilus assembly protein PilZ [Myxococcus xanthus]QDF07081.1 pilus assembly protein PilZ [Myxococcus xanthus]